ncbi:MAG: hypothetical protein AAF907_16250 [Planctomycetota bacterium]
MPTHRFTVHIADPPDLWERFDDLIDQFWADGKNEDASPSMSEEHMRIDFDRDAESFSDAVRSAVVAVRSIGLAVDRVVIERNDLGLMLGDMATVGPEEQGNTNADLISAAA